MSDCPRLEELQKLLADPRDQQAWDTLHAHLDRCPICRERLDTLHAADTLIPAQPAQWQPPVSSAALHQAVVKLRNEAPQPAETSTASSGGCHLSFLRPIDRPGYVGRLGNYAVRRVIGRGGMGMVLEAEDPVLKRTVAIKIISPWAVLDDETRSRFLREAQAAAAITHENVVTIHSVDDVDGLPFLVLEYVPGESLEDRLRRTGALPLDNVVQLGAGVARGLAAAHAKGLIHRDIKPANILLAEDTDRAKIADFGLAKMGGEHALTMTGTLLGTPEFMSPEQALGQQPDERSDLFSLGAVLYFASTAVSPFRGASLFETLDNVRRCQPRPLRELDASLPDWFCDLVHRLLSKDPQQRLGWASAVATLLEQSSAAKTVVDLHPHDATIKTARGPIDSGQLWRRPLAAAAALVTALALLGLVGLLANIPKRESNSPSVVRAPAAGMNASPQPATIPPGFTIAGNREHYANLTAAIAAAQDSQTIEIHGNGPFLTPPLVIEGKRLTIRPAADAQPVILPDSVGATVAKPFIQTDSDIRLEGIEVRWSMDVPIGRTESDLVARCIVAATHGKLHAAHCRIISNRFNACLGGPCRELVLKDCHLLGSETIGVFWSSQPAAKLNIDGCQFENRIAVSVLPNASPATTSAPTGRLTGNTFAAGRALQIVFEAPPRQPMAIHVERNLLDCDHLFMLNLVRPPRTPKGAAKLDDLVGLLQLAVAWTERANIHRAGMNYIMRGVTVRPSSVATADIQSLPAWLELWKLPTSGSIAGEIRFTERAESSPASPLVLEALNNASGPVPTNIGAISDRLGPGPAYHAWRASSDYGDWPNAAP